MGGRSLAQPAAMPGNRPDNSPDSPPGSSAEPARRDDSPAEARRVLLSRTFDDDAELYDRARPGYPAELYDDLADLAGAVRGSRGSPWCAAST